MLRERRRVCIGVLHPGRRLNPPSSPPVWERREEGRAEQRRAAAARRLADLPVTPPTRERGMSVGGAGAQRGLPWQHLQCTGAIVYLPLRGLANGGILMAPSLMFPDRRTD